MSAKYICIEGNLGAGKTTLAKKLAKTLEVHLILETFMNNPFLQGLYEDKGESKFPAEVFFLTERLEQLTPSIFEENELIIADYWIEKTALFAKTNLTGHELMLFERIFNIAKNQTTRPDALIYIDQTPEQALGHIKSRGRELEKEVSLSYLQYLDTEYQELLQSPALNIPVFKVSAMDLRSDFAGEVSRIIKFLTEERLLLAKSQVKLTL